jgi:hypothetical protein
MGAPILARAITFLTLRPMPREGTCVVCRPMASASAAGRRSTSTAGSGS